METVMLGLINFTLIVICYELQMLRRVIETKELKP
jgi:hypothetical protein